MASKVALAKKAEAERQELIDRIAALEDQVKALTDVVSDLVEATKPAARRSSSRKKDGDA